MLPSGRRRRRLIALGFLTAGALFAGLRDQAPWPRAAMIVAPAALLYGLVGLIYPAAVHDFIRPEFGALQLWIETGRRGFHVGLAAMVLGVLIGFAWVLDIL